MHFQNQHAYTCNNYFETNGPATPADNRHPSKLQLQNRTKDRKGRVESLPCWKPRKCWLRSLGSTSKMSAPSQHERFRTPSPLLGVVHTLEKLLMLPIHRVFRYFKINSN